MDVHWNRFPGGCDKALLFSFDDGCAGDRRLVSLMNQYGIKGTFHLSSGLLGREGYLQPDEIHALYAGHEVAGHTRSHVFLSQLPHRMQLRELTEDRKPWRRIAAISSAGCPGPTAPMGRAQGKPRPCAAMHTAAPPRIPAGWSRRRICWPGIPRCIIPG